MAKPADVGSRRLGSSCPICHKPSDPALHPFCSKRCADVDLHRWLAGTYAVPGDTYAEDGEPKMAPEPHEKP